MKTTPRFLRLRALVQVFTSPRRVWFWTATLPVLLAPVALYMLMQPGVQFLRRAKVGAVSAYVVRLDESEDKRNGMARITWPGGSVWASCWAFPREVKKKPLYAPARKSHRLGPLAFRWESGAKGGGLVFPTWSLTVGINH